MTMMMMSLAIAQNTQPNPFSFFHVPPLGRAFFFVFFSSPSFASPPTDVALPPNTQNRKAERAVETKKN